MIDKERKPDFKKEIDWSMMNDGTTIPLEYHRLFKGDRARVKKDIILILDDVRYPVILRDVNYSNSERDVLQIRYSPSNDFLRFLRQKYKVLYQYMEQEKAINQKNGNGKKQINVPDELKVFIEFYKSNEEDVYEIKINTIQKETIENIKQYIQSKNFSYNPNLIENFYLSLKSKPFVILAGTSGTGKSKLVELFANAVGSTNQNGRYKVIPVRPDWSDPTDLLGHTDLKGNFHPGPLTSIVERAYRDGENPYFVCLDEMNLARVEHYFSDILSIMESRQQAEDKIVTNNLFESSAFKDDDKAKGTYEDLYIPDNLFIIGTVNMDETTFPFSKKVLDRANTIEFSYVNLDFEFSENEEEVTPSVVSNKIFKSEYVKLSDCIEYEEKLKEIVVILKEINDKLVKANMHFGFRVRDEICYYMIYNERFELMKFDDALDLCILQKILPRIQGSTIVIKESLIELFKIAIGNSKEQFDKNDNDLSETLSQYLRNNNSILYRRTAEKILFMIRRFEEDGFTSYWL